MAGNAKEMTGTAAGTFQEKEREARRFLEEFYQAEEVEHDSLGRKLAASFLPESIVNRSRREKWSGRQGTGGPDNQKQSRLGMARQAAAELREEGAAGEQILYDDIFEVDSEAFLTNEKRKLSKRTKVSLFLLLVLIPLTIAAGVILFRNTSYSPDGFLKKIFGSRVYYFISLVIMVYALLPFFMVFEGRKPQAREMVTLASLAALACAGRAAFFMVPSFKPIVAIVILSGIAFGGEAGFLVGAVTMLVSNFLFGQGPWTPWQMFAMGFIGFLSGILHQKGLLPAKRLTLCIYGFLVTFFIYGGIMNPAALFMSVYEFTWEGLLAIYISGVPVDLVHASSTFIFLWLGAKPLLEKLQRIKIKYGLL